MEKNLPQRLLIIAIVLLLGLLMLRDPRKTLRPGLDIAGGTALIYEIDTTGRESDPELAERVKELLQRRVDPQGVYDLVWRVHGRNRIEVQMPLPPRDARQRLAAYRDALERLFEPADPQRIHEITRGSLERALDLAGEQRAAALERLARRNADAALAALTPAERPVWEPLISEAISTRRNRLDTAAAKYDALQAARVAMERGPEPTAEAAATAPAETQSATAPAETQPATGPAEKAATKEDLELAYRDALEEYEDAVYEVLGTNLSRRRFQEILDLDAKSKVRLESLQALERSHPDLRAEMQAVVAAHAAWRSGRRFLDGPADLKRLLQGSGRLEFRILVEPSPENVTRFDRYRTLLKDELRKRLEQDGVGWFRIDNPMQFFNFDSPAQLDAFGENYKQHDRYVVERLGDDYYVLAKITPDDGLLYSPRWRLVAAQMDRDEQGRWCVRFRLNAVGGQMFERLTRANIGKPLCILVDDVAYSAPNINSAIRTDGVIEGEFSLEKVTYLVRTMEGGTLPARLKDTPLSERTIGSSLGETNLRLAMRAGLIGAAAVVLIMAGYYWVCGLIANVAMLMNVFLTLAALAMLSARITLDGIAGIILSVGMAVDANVLIYERMREEKERGTSLRMLIKNGYDKALSTIFDSNITTLLTCIIIYYVGSEEVKGFGLTLGWGIVLNLFTSVFVTRTIFAVLIRYGVIKEVRMLKMIGVPRIDWHGKSRYVIPFSVLILAVGVGLLFVRGQDLFDVEFRGGVSAELELKQQSLDDVAIARQLGDVARTIADSADRLAQATVTPVPDEPTTVLVQVPGVPAERLAAMLAEPLEHEVQREGVQPVAGTDRLRLILDAEPDPAALAARIRGLRETLRGDARDLARARVHAVLEQAGVQQAGKVWSVTTTVTNTRLFTHALMSALGDELRIQPRVRYVFEGRGERPYRIENRLLENVVPGVPPGVSYDLTDYLGGAAICLRQLDPPLAVDELRARLDNMHFQPDFQDQPKRRFDVIGLSPAGDRTDEAGRPLFSDVVVVTTEPEVRYDDPEVWWASLAQPELRLVEQALSTEQTLQKVMHFKPQIARRSTQQASIALLLSWGMIIAYVWIRFGKVRYGVGGVAALVHDALMALAFVGFSAWIAATPFGRAMLVEDFKVNMTIVAALLTIIGFSINDTIVIFDRIRELRGRLGLLTPKIVNDSINECMSRTILTAFTVLVVVLIAYIFGGRSIRGFNYCMLVGCLSGTYSTIFIAVPLLLYRLRLAPGAANNRSG